MAASEVPSGARGALQRLVGSAPAIPSDFHTSQCWPAPSVCTLGSIEPPNSRWHTSGAGAGSTKGPSGSGLVAAPMHWRPLARSRAE